MAVYLDVIWLLNFMFDSFLLYLTALILKRDIFYKYIPRDDYAAFGFSGAEELADMFEVQRLFIPNRWADLMESYEMNPAMQTFESWLIKNKPRFDAYFNSLLNNAAKAA